MSGVTLIKSFTMLALVCGATAMAADSPRRARVAGRAEALDLLVTTRIPRIEVGSRLVYSRGFDPLGRLLWYRTEDRTGESPLVETLSIDRVHDGQLWIREITRGGNLVRRDLRRFDARDALVAREEEWSEGEAGALDRRAVSAYAGIKSEIVEYALENGIWKETSRRVVEGVDTRRTTDDIAPTYAQCIAEAEGFSGNATAVAACRAYLTDLPLSASRIAEISFDGSGGLDCPTDETYFLANGYRIDRASCATPEAEEALRRATYDVMSEYRSCLASLNTTLLEKFSQTVQTHRPLLRCAGDKGGIDPGPVLCPSGTSDRAACLARTARTRRTSGAFFPPSRPRELFLTGIDPVGSYPVDPSARGPGGISPIMGEDERESAEAEYERLKEHFDRELASSIFHETLHACDHDHNGTRTRLQSEGHNHSPPNRGDAVFGCEALCGEGDPPTRDGCRACLTAFDNDPDDDLLETCDGYPGAATLAAVTEGEEVLRLVENCAAPSRRAKNCEKLKDSTLYDGISDSVCPPRPRDATAEAAREPPSADCLAALRTAAVGRLGSVAGAADYGLALDRHTVVVRDGGIIMSLRDSRSAELGGTLGYSFCAEIEGTPSGEAGDRAIATIRNRYVPIAAGIAEPVRLVTQDTANRDPWDLPFGAASAPAPGGFSSWAAYARGFCTYAFALNYTRYIPRRERGKQIRYEVAPASEAPE